MKIRSSFFFDFSLFLCRVFVVPESRQYPILLWGMGELKNGNQTVNWYRLFFLYLHGLLELRLQFLALELGILQEV